MHIGLIGGIGPAATDYYYRGLIDRAAKAGRDLDCTIVHADSQTLIANLAANAVAAQSAIYHRVTERLAAAGAGCVAVTSIGGHFCIDAFAKDAALPVIDLTKAMAEELARLKLSRVGILGTRTVMQSGMYGKLEPVDVIAPSGAELDAVHEAYVALAVAGHTSPELDQIFLRAGGDLADDGAEAILLGGTDLVASFQNLSPAFRVIDCAAVHVDRLAELI